MKKINLKNKKIIRNVLVILITTLTSVNLIYAEVKDHNYYLKIGAEEISKYTASENYTIIYFSLLFVNLLHEKTPFFDKTIEFVILSPT